MISEIDFPAAEAGREQWRFSQPCRVLCTSSIEEVPAVLEEAERLARAGLWLVGMVAYEAAPAFDPALRCASASSALPLAAFAAYDAPDDAAPPAEAGQATCGEWRPNTSNEHFEQGMSCIAQAIDRGEYYQVNYTTRFRAAFRGDPHALFRELCDAQPEAYRAFLDGGDWQVLSVSPELFFEWSPQTRQLLTRPMKGTAARGNDAAADALAERTLTMSAKERAENLMIVDLLRNDMSRIAETGSVQVPRLFETEALPTAWQMTSTVSCRARAEIGLADIFRALFPCGSVTGAPKVAAMRAIAALEREPRGVYCGAIGLIRPGGEARFSVAIRTVTVDAARGLAECGIGSGITADSTAVAEYAEWLVKRRFLLRASAGFRLLETLRLEEGRYWLLDGHLRRLRGGAEQFGFALDAQRVSQALADLAAAQGRGAWRVRLLVGRRGDVQIEHVSLDATPSEVAVALAAAPIDSACEFLRFKTTERAQYALHETPGEGVFDTLLYNERGEITEFTRGNVIVEIDGRRVTPPEACGLLAGVMREELLGRGEVVEAVVRRDDLARATGLWFINSVRGMLSAKLVGT